MNDLITRVAKEVEKVGQEKQDSIPVGQETKAIVEEVKIPVEIEEEKHNPELNTSIVMEPDDAKPFEKDVSMASGDIDDDFEIGPAVANPVP